jgi:hypothetical protein
MRLWYHRALVLLVLATMPVLASEAGNPDDLQARFEHEPNSVRKAKLFERLGDEQLAETRRASQAADFATVGEIMEKYRDNARVALNALRKEHPDAERQLNGYKQLQMHVRKALRELKEMVIIAPAEYKPPLQLVQNDLASMDDELLGMLFPRRPGKDLLARPTNPTPETAPAGPDKPANQPASTPEEKPEDKAEANQPAENAVENTEEKLEMNIQNCLLTAVVTCGLAVSCAQVRAQVDQKDYLSPMEADKIRDAETTNARMNLFVTFADDRLKKFQYELQHPSPNRHGELLNALMNGYVGCLDDAADLMQLGIEKQENIRQGVDLIASKGKEFLEALNKIAADKIEIDIYKDNLDDAIEGTRDAINDAEKAKKAVAPPPVRRKN